MRSYMVVTFSCEAKRTENYNNVGVALYLFCSLQLLSRKRSLTQGRQTDNASSAFTTGASRRLWEQNTTMACCCHLHKNNTTGVMYYYNLQRSPTFILLLFFFILHPYIHNKYTSMKVYKTIAEKWRQLFFHEEQYQDKWLADEIMARLMNANAQQLKLKKELTRSTLNSAIQNQCPVLDHLDRTLPATVYYPLVYRQWVMQEYSGRLRGMTFYFICHKRRPDCPPVEEEVLAAFEEIYRCESPLLMSEQNNDNNDNNDSEENNNNNTNNNNNNNLRKSEILAQGMDFWNSATARKLFLAEDETGNVREIIQRKVEQLRNVALYVDGWREVVDDDDQYSPHQIHVLKQRCQLLCCAYLKALELMPGVPFRKCCQQACDLLNPLGITATTTGTMVLVWNRHFRKNVFQEPPRTRPKTKETSQTTTIII